MATKTKTRPAPEPEPNLEDLDESAEAEEGAKVAANQEAPAFGTNELAALIKEQTGKEYTTRDLRALIRRMARSGEGVTRDISRDNPTRYSWTGPKDPEVIAIVKQVKQGKVEKARQEALDDLKEKGKAKREAKRAAKEKAKKVESLDDEAEDETDEAEDTDED
jgi:hypothetical protein